MFGERLTKIMSTAAIWDQHEVELLAAGVWFARSDDGGKRW
jgi:hypothetical protein